MAQIDLKLRIYRKDLHYQLGVGFFTNPFSSVESVLYAYRGVAQNDSDASPKCLFGFFHSSAFSNVKS